MFVSVVPVRAVRARPCAPAALSPVIFFTVKRTRVETCAYSCVEDSDQPPAPRRVPTTDGRQRRLRRVTSHPSRHPSSIRGPAAEQRQVEGGGATRFPTSTAAAAERERESEARLAPSRRPAQPTAVSAACLEVTGSEARSHRSGSGRAQKAAWASCAGAGKC